MNVNSIIKSRVLRRILDWSILYYGIIIVEKASLSYSLNPVPYQHVPMSSVDNNELEDTPEGYYAFIESPKMEPPQVKLPPYTKSSRPCGHSGAKRTNAPPHPWRKTLNNLCGDLNKGAIPLNPMNQNIYGTPYPFELIKNKTLEYFSRTLPILKADETVPKVATVETEPQYYLYQQPSTANFKPQLSQRMKRDAGAEINEASPKRVDDTSKKFTEYSNTTQRQSRKTCNDKGILCFLYNLFQDQVLKSIVAQKRQDPPHLEYRTSADSTPIPMVDGPPTPCPANVEYASPVFARNYQGIWRYVVQIPFEGYFTQTIEVTKCLNSKCHYMDGGCLSSPRWVSLLVAEIYYPDTLTPINRRPPINRSPVMVDDLPPLNNFHRYQQYLRKRAVPPNGDPRPLPQIKKTHCDGVDEQGCFQVRLYYDWFLVPGSCKCWKPDYFSKFMRWSREASYEL